MERRDLDLNENPDKLMAGAIKAFKTNQASRAPSAGGWDSDVRSIANVVVPFCDNPTVSRTGSFGPGSSGIIKKCPAPRKRPPKIIREARLKEVDRSQQVNTNRREGKQEIGSNKRKMSVQELGGLSSVKAKSLKVVPNEGLPNPQ